MRIGPLWLAAFAVLVAGCGGGGGSASSSGSGGGGNVDVGPFTGTGAVAGNPVTTNSPNWSAIAFNGTFSSLRLQTNGVRPESLRFLAALGKNDISPYFRLAYLGAGSTELEYVGPSTMALIPAVSPDARTIVFTQITGVSPTSTRLKKMNYDGTGVANLTSPPANTIDAQVSFSPTGQQVAFLRYPYTGVDYELRKVNMSTGAVSAPLVTDPDLLAMPRYSNDGKFIYYVAKAGQTLDAAYKVPAGGGTPALVYADSTSSIQEVVDAPNGDGQVVLYGAGGSFVIEGVGGQSASRTILTEPGSAASLAPIPNSPYLGFVSSIRNGVVYRVLNIETGETQTIFTSSQDLGLMAAVPPQAARVLAGTGGLFGSSLNGLVASLHGTTVGTAVGFKATTASTVQISSLSGDNTTGPNLNFEVKADTLTSMSFLDMDMTLPTVVVGTTPKTANGAFVSLDAETGKVAAILPYTGTRSASAFEQRGQESSFRGQFLAVYDGSGKNLAPGGASQVRVSSGSKVTIQR